MGARQEKNGTWTAQFRYEDIYGRSKHKCKRGFATEAEADRFEKIFKGRTANVAEMRFCDFLDFYEDDVAPMIRENTWRTKENMINAKILPFFGTMIMKDITTLDTIRWQNELLEYKDKNGKPYSDTYLRTINGQAVAIFNHANRFYNLEPNPFKNTPRIGSKTTHEIKVWSKDEYLRFSDTLVSNLNLFVAFELLYWCGLRVGELLALTPADFNFQTKMLSVSKSYQRINSQDVITAPKTENGIRQIALPDFICDEVKDLIYVKYQFDIDERIFKSISKHVLAKKISEGAQATGVSRIRVHDLRHSHVSLLIDMGYSVVAIAERMGHENADITLHYGHMMPNTEAKIGKALDDYNAGDDYAL